MQQDLKLGVDIKQRELNSTELQFQQKLFLLAAKFYGYAERRLERGQYCGTDEKTVQLRAQALM